SPGPPARVPRLVVLDVLVLRRTPAVPAVDLDPRVDPFAVAHRVLLSGVVLGQPVDGPQVHVVLQGNHPPLQADVRVPALLVQDGQGDPRIRPHVLEPFAAFVHVDQHATVLPRVPGRHGDRLAVRAQRGDDTRVGLRQQLAHLIGQWWFRHDVLLVALFSANLCSPELSQRPQVLRQVTTDLLVPALLFTLQGVEDDQGTGQRRHRPLGDPQPPLDGGHVGGLPGVRLVGFVGLLRRRLRHPLAEDRRVGRRRERRTGDRALPEGRRRHALLVFDPRAVGFEQTHPADDVGAEGCVVDRGPLGPSGAGYPPGL